MILNAWTVAALFLAATGAALALTGAFLGLRGARRAPRSSPDALEDDAHLLALVLAVLFGVRALAWPLFYAILSSFVPELAAQGVMCPYGVAETAPGLALSTQVLKPVALAAIGLWAALARVDRAAGTHALTALRFGAAPLIAALVLAEIGLEVAFLLAPTEAGPVTCCTQFLDTAGRAGTDVSGLSVGALGRYASLAVFALVNGSLVAAALHVWRGARRGAGESGPPKAGARRAARLALAAASLGVLGLDAYLWHDAFSPVLLQLPYHHCLYELVARLPVMALAAVATVAGCALLLGPAALEPWRSRAPRAVDAVAGETAFAGAACVATAGLLAIVHVL